MKVTNNMRLYAKQANLPHFMNKYYPGRLVRKGHSFKDTKYTDVSVWYADDHCFRFTAFGDSKNIRPEIVGTDTIAYVRKYCEGLEDFDVASKALYDFYEEENSQKFK